MPPPEGVESLRPGLAKAQITLQGEAEEEEEEEANGGITVL